MKMRELLLKLSDFTFDSQSVARIENEYRARLPIEIRKIISLHEHTVSYDDFPLLRGLSTDEIMDASSNMAADFIGKKLLPLFDVGDNDYIVFSFDEHCWYKFNIVDDIKFSKAINLSDYF